MNFPVGEVIGKGKFPSDFLKIVNDLANKKFSGYVIQSVVNDCFEEGVLFFKNGDVIGCTAECLSVNFLANGNDALKYFFNQTKGDGVYQIVSLSGSQVDLVTAFDKKILLSNKLNLKGLPKLIPIKFQSNFKKTIEKSKKDIGRLDDLKRSLLG